MDKKIDHMCELVPVLGIRDILVQIQFRIRIRTSDKLTRRHIIFSLKNFIFAKILC